MTRTAMHAILASAAEDFDMKLFSDFKFRRALETALDQTGKREQRKCPLTAALMIQLVVSMALHRSMGVPSVFHRMIEWLRARYPSLELDAVTDEALVKARQRLGAEPLEALYKILAQTVDPVASFGDLRSWSVDGVALNMPDTAANEVAFGRHKSSRAQPTAFPQLHAIVLISNLTRQTRAIALGRCHAPERPACVQFLEYLGPQDVVFLDCGFYAIWLLEQFEKKGAHVVCRLPASAKPKILEVLAPGDYIVKIRGRVPIAPEECQGREKTHRTVWLRKRMIEYKADGEVVRLVTDLTDPEQYSFQQIARGFHERWESEIGNDELKTHLLAVAGGACETTFRSKLPEGVRQEAYGLFVAYNLARSVMLASSRKHNVPARNLSFVRSLESMRQAIPTLQKAKPNEITQSYRRLLRDIAATRNKRPRRPRRYDRVVRIKFARFPRKRACHKQQIVDIDNLIQPYTPDCQLPLAA